MNKKTYHLLILLAIFGFVFSFFLTKEDAVDIHLHDTYFVIGKALVLRFFALVLTVTWVLYLLFQKLMYSKLLIWVHVLGSISSSLLIYYTLNFNRSGNMHALFEFSAELAHTKWLIALLCSFVGCQLMLAINIIVGILRKYRNI